MKIFKMIVVSFFLMNFMACGKNSANRIVSDVKVLSSTLENGDVVLDMSALFNLGNLSMTSVQVAILDPDDPSHEFGEFRIRPTLDFKNEVGIKVNLSNAAGVRGEEAMLPNGLPLPVGGLSESVIQLKLGKLEARLYLDLDLERSKFLLGFALPIKEFDQVSRYVGAVNIFPGFFIKGIRGMAGIFTGEEANTSGLGFFLDLGSVLNPKIKHENPFNFSKGVQATRRQKCMVYETLQELNYVGKGIDRGYCSRK